MKKSTLVNYLRAYISLRDQVHREELVARNMRTPSQVAQPILDDKQKQMLIDDLCNFIELGVDKYINGALEHGGTVLDVDSIEATKEEIFDAWIYTNATKRKLMRL